MIKKISIFCIMLCILVSICCTGMQNIASIQTMAKQPETLDITSKSACLVDFASGTMLFEKDANKHLPIASMVKMMTILITLEEMENENLSEDTLITTSENASGMGGSQVFIDPFVEYKAGDLLKGVIIASANDASVALAEHISGSEKTFVARMNERAKELGMNDTNYSNCTGLPAPEQYSCARDCAIVLKEVSKHDIYHKYSTIWMEDFIHPSGRKTEIVNTNRLVKYYEGCDSGKTGSTNEAGCCLSASAKRNNMRLISVVIGAQNSQTRFNECSKLFNYGFANYENKEIVSQDKALFKLPVNKGKINEVDVFSQETFSVVAKKGDKTSYDITYENPNKITAPLSKGDKVGKVIISKEGNVLKEINLVVGQDLEKVSLKDCFDKIVVGW